MAAGWRKHLDQNQFTIHQLLILNSLTVQPGAAVDSKTGEAGWDVKPGEAQGAAVDYFPTDQLGGPYVGGAGWDMPGPADPLAL